jgi:hypothetical protein
MLDVTSVVPSSAVRKIEQLVWTVTLQIYQQGDGFGSTQKHGLSWYFCRFSHSLQAYVREVILNLSKSLPSIPFPNHYSVITIQIDTKFKIKFAIPPFLYC